MNFAQPTWPGLTPRRWQVEAFELIAEHLAGDAPEGAIIQAVMGSGKSILLAEVCATAEADTIVVTTSSRDLVRQLSNDIAKRVGHRHVGRFYSDAKEANRRVIVCCIDSAATLAIRLRDMGRKVDLWIADEAHQTAAPSFEDAHELMDPQASLGLSATPYRASQSEELSLFKQIIYSYSPIDALQDGVILPWRVEPWDGDEETPLDDACIELCMRGVSIGPGLANATSIADADAFSEKLNDAGMRSLPVYSKGMSTKERGRRLRMLEHGELDVVVHVSTLQEGVNIPWLRWLCLRRRTNSRVRFAQECGRVLRTHPGKEEGVIFDPHDLFGSMSLTADAVLWGQAKSIGGAELGIEQGEDGWWRTSKDPLIAGFARGREIKLYRRCKPATYQEAIILQVREDGIKLDREVTVMRLVGAADLMARLNADREDDELDSAAKQAALELAPETHATALVEAARYLRRLSIELEQTGMYSRKLYSRRMRGMEVQHWVWAAYKGQLKRSKASSHKPPEPYAEALRNACRLANELSNGDVLDLTSILRFIEQKGWPSRLMRRVA
jgi:hypothetical protein